MKLNAQTMSFYSDRFLSADYSIFDLDLGGFLRGGAGAHPSRELRYIWRRLTVGCTGVTRHYARIPIMYKTFRKYSNHPCKYYSHSSNGLSLQQFKQGLASRTAGEVIYSIRTFSDVRAVLYGTGFDFHSSAGCSPTRCYKFKPELHVSSRRSHGDA